MTSTAENDSKRQESEITIIIIITNYYHKPYVTLRAAQTCARRCHQ